MLHKLSAADARRLTAGQVMYEVVGAVKELIENSLDAGAQRIELELEARGLDLLRVIDNGSGIPPEALPLLGQQSHTSKIDSWDSLTRCTSYGFRGEALHALVNSSESVVVRSAERNGRWLQLKLGDPSKIPTECSAPTWVHGKPGEPHSLPHGTVVEVSGLFQRFPVRRAAAQAEDVIKKLTSRLHSYAIARPQVAFAAFFRRPPSANFVKVPEPDAAMTVYALFGPLIADALQPVSRPNLPFGLSLACLLPKSDHIANCIRGNSERSFYYLNARPVDLPSLSKALNSRIRTYAKLASTHSFPTCVVSVTAPPNLIDWNVSPDKRKMYLQAHVMSALETCWQALLKELYPLPLDGQIIAVPDSPPPDELHTQQYLAEHGDLPSTQPGVGMPQPQPYDATELSIPISVQSSAAPSATSSASASAVPLPHSPPRGARPPGSVPKGTFPLVASLLSSSRAPPPLPPAPKPSAPVPPAAASVGAAAAAQPSAPPSKRSAAAPVATEQGEYDEGPPAEGQAAAKRKRVEKEALAFPLHWAIEDVKATVQSVPNLPPPHPLSLSDARSAVVVCFAADSEALVRVGTQVYVLSVSRLTAMTASPADASVEAKLSKLTSLVDAHGEALFQAPQFLSGAPQVGDM